VDRLTFLARLRQRLEQGALDPGAAGASGSAATGLAEAGPRAATPGARRAEDVPGDDLVGLFAERLRASGGEVAVVASRAEAWAALARLAGERGWQAVACASGLRPAAAVGAAEPVGAGSRLSFTSEPSDADMGLSEADWAVAETGSVVVQASADVRRGYSLVPTVVGFFVPLTRLRATMGDVLRELPADCGSLPSCVSFVSGPSGTSDLAAVHVVGVHGPGEVFVWVIEGDEPAGPASIAGPALSAG
jgi:L-lactate dehydrogenase complex protein LldG